MGRIVAVEHVSLDGVMQAPGRPDEDTRGGFEHGGWGGRYQDQALGAEMGKRMDPNGTLLFGRRTYLDFADYWPKQDSPYTEVLNGARKYVVSRTLTEPLPWRNSTLLSGDVAESVAALKRESDGDIGILGSGELVRTLTARGLIDEYVLVVYPLLLGTGTRLFANEGALAELRMTHSVTTTKGVIVATYQRA